MFRLFTAMSNEMANDLEVLRLELTVIAIQLFSVNRRPGQAEEEKSKAKKKEKERKT